MEERQTAVISRCIRELSEALVPDLLLSHLVLSGIFSVEEKMWAQKCGSNQMIIHTALRLLTHKRSGFETLMEFLHNNNYGGRLVKELEEWNQPEANGHKHDERDISSSLLMGKWKGDICPASCNHCGQSKGICSDCTCGITDTEIIFPEPSLCLPCIIDKMGSNIVNADQLMKCLLLIAQGSSDQLRQMESSLKQSFVEVCFSVVNHHCRHSLIVESYCDLMKTIDISLVKFKGLPRIIDILLDTSRSDNFLTSSAQKSALKLLGTVAEKTDVSQIGAKPIETICQAIQHHLNSSSSSEYDDILEIRWNCLLWFCFKSEENMNIFLVCGGMVLFQQCYKMFISQTNLVSSMMCLMLELSTNKSTKNHLSVEGDLEFLWYLWRETEIEWISFYWSLIFANFFSNVDWPLGHPTLEEVRPQWLKMKLTVIEDAVMCE